MFVSADRKSKIEPSSRALHNFREVDRPDQPLPPLPQEKSSDSSGSLFLLIVFLSSLNPNKRGLPAATK